MFHVRKYSIYQKYVLYASFLDTARDLVRNVSEIGRQCLDPAHTYWRQGRASYNIK